MQTVRERDKHTPSRKTPEPAVVNHVSGKENGMADDDFDENDGPVDEKIEKEISELSKMKDSGAAKVILEDLKKKRHEKVVIDPRSASRTPSAAVAPPYRPRYDSPLFACRPTFLLCA